MPIISHLNAQYHIVHHGGKSTVTGSCHELCLPHGHVLIDCGLFQGTERPEDIASTSQSHSSAIHFDVAPIQALLITHAHIDHIGRLPWLLAAGFKQPIYCTHASAALIPLMLEDGLKLQFSMSKRQRRRVLKYLQRLLCPIDYGQWQDLPQLGRFRLQPAGHILGSAYIEYDLPNQERVVFSGDLGSCDTPLLPDPKPPERADYLLLESTYGGKCHENVAQRRERLFHCLEHALKNRGSVIIPAFSVGRTQELLFDIEQLLHEHKLDARLPIILDSPLAQRVTKAYRSFRTLWSQEAKHIQQQGRHPLAFDQCMTITDHASHARLVNRLACRKESAIVIAASGMCQGGRVVNYLKQLLPDPCHDVLFAGYQAHGTLGAQIQQCHQGSQSSGTVWIDGESISVRANIHTVSGYSAHADHHDLMRFAAQISPAPKRIIPIHGNLTAQRKLMAALQDELQ